MVIHFITKPKWMVGEQFTVAEMMDEILVHSVLLDPRGKYMFIQWLQNHCNWLKYSVDVSQQLTTWFESMPRESMQWKYRLILDEIVWWSSLDKKSLTRIMLADLTRNGAG